MDTTGGRAPPIPVEKIKREDNDFQAVGRKESRTGGKKSKYTVHLDPTMN